MGFVPANVVKDARWIRFLLLLQLRIQVVFCSVHKLAVVRKFLHVVIHRSNVASNQLVDASISLILYIIIGKGDISMS